MGGNCMRVHKIREIYLQTREDLRRGIYYNDNGAKEKRSGKTSDLLQKGQTKKKGRSLNYEEQKILGSTDGRADGTGYGSLQQQ